jgi:hypothetical protein
MFASALVVTKDAGTIRHPLVLVVVFEEIENNPTFSAVEDSLTADV